jgi:hypothetical protein
LDALACCAEVAAEPNTQAAFVYEPLGPCLEGGILSNLFGAGCLILRTDRFPLDAPLVRRLLDPAGLWSFLVEISLAGRNWDVSPDIQISLEPQATSFSYADTDYSSHVEVLQRYGQGYPLWLRYALLNTVGSEHNLLALQNQLSRKEEEIRAISKLNPGKIIYKVKREATRFLNQCRALLKRGGAS